MKINASQLAAVVGGRVEGNASLYATEVITDSRTSGYGNNTLFVALHGPNHNGHDFIMVLYGRGVRFFMTEYLPEEAGVISDAAFVIVKDTLEALHKMAGWHRTNFSGRVIAVTGSAGKTIVKEWLAETLSAERKVIRSPKSYNSQTGVPLSLLNIEDEYNTAVIEAGISGPGEMIRLAEMIRPDTVVVTNIGEAHGENFNGKDEVAREKLLLARDASLIVYNYDDYYVRSEIEKSYPDKEFYTWSLSDSSATLRVRAETEDNGSTILLCRVKEEKFKLSIPFSDRASIENAVSVLAVSLSEGLRAADLRSVFGALPVVAMRMSLKKGIKGCTLIEDYYNSDPGSLRMAIDFLIRHAKGKKSLILSDFRQVSHDEATLYEGIAAVVRQAGIDRFTGIGEALSRNRHFFTGDASFFVSTADFIETLRTSKFHDETILLKGARSFEFERISAVLEQQLHLTRLEINMDAVSHNLNEFRRMLAPGTGIMAMLKAFAYGAGSAEIASLLEYHHVDYLAVAYADEGVALRESGITLPVMVMNPDAGVMDLMIRYKLEPEIYCWESFRSFSETALRHGVLHYPVHIKIDTGMHRLGFDPDDSTQLASAFREQDRLKVVSVFSHLAASGDEKHDDFTRAQVELLTFAAGEIRSVLDYDFRLHILNSSGICRFPGYHFDMVRIGIGLYGIGSYDGLSLRSTGRFVSAVSQVRVVPPGDSVGYDCNDISDHERLIAVVPVGYADGLRRTMGNGRGHLFVANTSVPVTGNVCMDMCMIDVTGLNVKAGDEVEIFGDNITIEEMARECDTIPYEILTSIPSRVKRIYSNE